jgi:hypothetical protein
MIRIGIKRSQLKALEEALGEKSKSLSKNIYIAINKTAKKVASMTAKDLATELPLKQKSLKKIIRQRGKASKTRLSATIGVGGGYNIPLKFFKPRYSKKNQQVTVQMEKSGSRKPVIDGFMVAQYGKSVFRRVGKNRLPIVEVYGPKPGDYYKKLGTQRKVKKLAKTELKKQIQERIRFNVLKKQNKI